MRNSQIRINVAQSDDAVEAIRWEADDSGTPGTHNAKGMILALWDAEVRQALRIDLWTQDMSIDDMNDFIFQTLVSLADTYHKATNNEAIMAEIKHFAQDFAERASRVEQNRTQPRT